MRFLWYTPTEYCRFSPIEAGLGIHSCNAAEYSMCVEPNGDVLPCQSYYEAAGNILADPWESIWDSDLFRRLRYRREHPGEAGLPQKCWDCEQTSSGACATGASILGRPACRRSAGIANSSPSAAADVRWSDKHCGPEANSYGERNRSPPSLKLRRTAQAFVRYSEVMRA